MIPIPDDFEVQPLESIPIKREEARHQAALVAALRRKWATISDIALRPVVFHIPMGGSRDAREASNLKTQGALAGVPDLVIVLPYGGMIWIEMKSSTGVLSPMQITLGDNFRALGHTLLVARSVYDALDQLRKLQ